MPFPLRSTIGAAALLLVAVMVRAAGTDPTLALTGAEAASGDGPVLVRLQGSLQFDDLLQFDFPAGVVVYQGTRFARVPVVGPVVSGSSSLLAGGLAPSELFGLLDLGASAAAPARLVTLTPTTISFVLPPGFDPGTATAVLYAVLEGDAFLSNPITVTLP